MVELDERPEGIVVSIRAHAGSRQNAVRGEQDGALKVYVTQAPEKGKANKAIIALLAKTLGLRKSQIDLIAGETSPHKKLLFREITAAELRARISQLEA